MYGNRIFSTLYDYDEYDWWAVVLMMMRMSVPMWQNEQQETAMKALESLCENSKDDAQVLTALRSVRTEIYKWVIFEYLTHLCPSTSKSIIDMAEKDMDI